MARAQKKLTKKELRQDPLVKTMVEAETWLQEYGQKLLIGVLIVAVVIVAGIFVKGMGDSKSEDAMLAFSQARTLLGENKVDEAKEAFQQVIDEFGGTRGAAEALFTLGQLQLADGNNEEALAVFKEFASKYNSEYMLNVAAFEAMATANENLGNWADAAAEYDQVIQKDKNGHMKPIALYKAGRCYALAGDKETARKRFQTVIDEYENLRIKSDAERELVSLELIAGQ